MTTRQDWARALRTTRNGRLNTDDEYFMALEQIEALSVTGPASWANLSASARGLLLGIDAQLMEYERRTQRYRTAVL